MIKGMNDDVNNEKSTGVVGDRSGLLMFLKALQDERFKQSRMTYAIMDALCEDCLRDVLVNVLKECGLDLCVLTGKSHKGLFGYTYKSSDVALKLGESKLLIEIKRIKSDSDGFQIRNAFGQLVEYLLEGNWGEAIVLIVDLRKNSSDYFGADDRGTLNKWFAGLFSLKDCPNNKLSKVELSVVRIFMGKDGKIGTPEYYCIPA